jgi:sugar phosphate isomerase/epimerase
MPAITRRRFLRHAAAGSAGLAWVAGAGRTAGAAPLGLPIGSQTYPHRQMVMEGNFVGLCKMMAEIGVGSLELCSPGYKEFASLKDAKQVKQILDDHRLISPSAHFTLGSLRKEQPAMIDWAKTIGMTQMVVATLGGGGRGATVTMDQVKAAADDYNRIAEGAAKAGLQQALHNEGFEAAMVDGRRVYDVLFELLDPKLVKFQFQMSSTRTLGIDPVAFFRQHKGRFISLHLQGVAPVAPAAPPAPAPPAPPPPSATGTPPTPAAAGAGARGGGRGQGLPVGGDSLNWADVFRAARDAGIRNYFVEQNWELTQKSVAFLKTLTV